MDEQRMKDAQERIKEYGFEATLIYSLMTLSVMVSGVDKSLYEWAVEKGLRS